MILYFLCAEGTVTLDKVIVVKLEKKYEEKQI
jgi:hypothetical protein